MAGEVSLSLGVSCVACKYVGLVENSSSMSLSYLLRWFGEWVVEDLRSHLLVGRLYNETSGIV